MLFNIKNQNIKVKNREFFGFVEKNVKNYSQGVEMKFKEIALSMACKGVGSAFSLQRS